MATCHAGRRAAIPLLRQRLSANAVGKNKATDGSKHAVVAAVPLLPVSALSLGHCLLETTAHTYIHHDVCQ